MKFRCTHCGKAAERPTGEVNRARAQGARLFCGRRCFGLDKTRRLRKPKAQRVEEKRIYDAAYRQKNLERILARKAAYHKRTYDPAKARVVRKKRAKWHVQYCRRPEYKRWKQVYDRRYRAKKFFGPFAEAAMVAIDLNRAIKERMTNDQIKWQNQTANKSQFRRRATAEEKPRARPRFRERRDGHSTVVGQ